jgi:hypothetical protein
MNKNELHEDDVARVRPRLCGEEAFLVERERRRRRASRYRLTTHTHTQETDEEGSKVRSSSLVVATELTPHAQQLTGRGGRLRRRAQL